MRLTPLDAGTTSIYERLINDLPVLVAKAFIAKVQFEPISAIFLLSRYFRLFQQYRPASDIKPDGTPAGRLEGPPAAP